jgi:MGT family glycosyltransferase
VYATFGSVAGSVPDAVPVFGMAMEALAGLPVSCLLTVGREVDLDSLPAAPPNVRLAHWVPQADVLPHAAAVVCHGGAGTTLGALAAGRPLVVVPLFADQPFNAARVAATGAGLAAATEPAAVRAALTRLLADERFGVAAERIATEMRGHGPVSAAIGALDASA